MSEKWSLGVTGTADAEFTDIRGRAIAAGRIHAIRAAVLGIRKALLSSPASSANRSGTFAPCE